MSFVMVRSKDCCLKGKDQNIFVERATKSQVHSCNPAVLRIFGKHRYFTPTQLTLTGFFLAVEIELGSFTKALK